MASSPLSGHDILKKLTDKKFIGGILEQLGDALRQMNAIGRDTFKEYNELSAKIEAFKESLLDFVLDSMIYLEILKDNFPKKKYQEETDLRKAQFIKSTLDKIDQTVLKTYLKRCLDLITLVSNLREKYGQKAFVIEYAVLNLIGSTLFGVVAGVVIGLVAPWTLPAEALAGGAAGLIIGIFRVGYTVVNSWRKWNNDIDNVREMLSQIKDGLEKICDELEKAHNCLSKAKIEGNHQEEQLRSSTNASPFTYKDVADLEQYVLATYDSFIDLRKVVQNSNMKKNS